MALTHFKKNTLAGLLLAAASIAQSSPLYDDNNFSSDLADNDKDGVVNVRDFCPSTAPQASVDNDGCSSEDRIVMSADLEVLFDTDKFNVKPIYYPEVKKIADFLKANPDTNVVIEGHTDSVGNNAHNLTLSQNRANAIASVLVDKFGINRARVRSVGFGETRPIASNDTDAGREQNRRVVAEIFAQRIEQKKRWDMYSPD